MNQDNLQKVVNDTKYTIEEQTNGQRQPRFVIRFNDEVIVSAPTELTAIYEATKHQDENL